MAFLIYISKMKNKIITYERALELVRMDNSPFYEIKTNLDGFNISMFNYRLASFNDFQIPGGSEMRGLTFVFNSDDTYTTFPLLEKFFNLNQVANTLYSEVKDLKVKSVYNKEDGSIASFIKLPNGRVLGKSKMSFDTDQAIGITRVYNTNSSVKRLVDWTLDNNITAIFEYVAPTNRIVLRYTNEDLILLRLRNNLTGELLNLNDFKDIIGDVSVAPMEEFSLNELVEMAKYVENKEGWIVEFENGLMLKVKTEWYFLRHGIMTNDLNRENVLIGYILDDTIDDVISQIPLEDVESRDRVNNLIEIVKKELDLKVESILNAYEFYKTIGNRKDYALNYRKGNKEFANVMSLANVDELKLLTKEEILELYDDYSDYLSLIERNTPYNLSKRWLYSETKDLEIARNWLDSVNK